jgi:hypothetical protein
MKWIFLFTLSVLTLYVNAQKLNKPKRNKKTGVTTTTTESERITRNKTKLLFGAEYDPVWFSISKTDTGSMYLSLSGQTAGYKFEMKKGDSAKISFTDGSTLWLLAMQDVKVKPSMNRVDNSVSSYWYNDYLLDAESRKILAEKEVNNIGVSAHDKSMNFSITPDPAKKESIKNALLLFKE